jgi:hypothetical protein
MPEHARFRLRSRIRLLCGRDVRYQSKSKQKAPAPENMGVSGLDRHCPCILCLVVLQERVAVSGLAPDLSLFLTEDLHKQFRRQSTSLPIHEDLPEN